MYNTKELGLDLCYLILKDKSNFNRVSTGYILSHTRTYVHFIAYYRPRQIYRIHFISIYRPRQIYWIHFTTYYRPIVSNPKQINYTFSIAPKVYMTQKKLFSFMFIKRISIKKKYFSSQNNTKSHFKNVLWHRLIWVTI